MGNSEKGRERLEDTLSVVSGIKDAADAKIIKKDIRKILLINAAPRAKGLDVRPPFSLYGLYMVLKKEFGDRVEIKVLDLAIQDADFKIKDYLIQEGPDLVGVSTSCSFYAGFAEEMSRVAKEALPETVLVNGGIHASVVPFEVVQESPLDFLVQGDGEIVFPEALRVIMDGDGDISKVGGIWYIDSNGQPASTGNPVFPSLDDLPLGVPDILDEVIGKYDLSSPYFGGEKAWQLFCSRGCPVGCKFCAVEAISGQKIRAMSPERVVAEIKHIVRRYNIHNFNFTDDFFTFNIERARKISELILQDQELSNVKWKITTRADRLPEDLVEIMARAGLIHISFGIESPDPTVLKAIQKSASVGSYKKATALAHKYGIRVRHLLMAGLPEQDEQSIDKTIDFLEEARPDEIFVAIYTPFPGSEYSKNPELYGFLPTHISYEDMIMREVVQEGDIVKPVVAVPTRWMTAEEILRARDKIVTAFEEIQKKDIRGLLKNLRSPDMETRKIAARRLRYVSSAQPKTCEDVLEEASQGLVERFRDKNRLVLALAGPGASGKFTLYAERFKAFFSRALSVTPDSVVMLTDNNYLLPISERRDLDYLSKFEIDRWFKNIRLLQEGEAIYSPLYDRLRNDRLRIDEEIIAEILQNRGGELQDGTEPVYRFEIEGIEMEGEELEEIYIDINPANNSVRGEFDILEKIDPEGKIIVVKATICLLDPEINDGYDERFFVQSDFSTRLIRGVKRWRKGMGRQPREAEYIDILKKRRAIEDDPYILPTRMAARFVIENNITTLELEEALRDSNPEVRRIANELSASMSSLHASGKTSPKESRNIYNPLVSLRENRDLETFIEIWLTRRYDSWGLREDLAKDILETLLRYAEDLEQAINRLYSEVIDFETDEAWQEAYSRYKEEVKYADTYNQMDVYLGGLPDDSVIVDVGAGNNMLGKLIATKHPGFSVIGTDAYDYHEEHGLENLVFLVQPRPLNIPLDDRSADIVIMNAMLHHVSPDDMGAFLQEIRRVLKPGGKVILVEDTYSITLPVENEATDSELTSEFLDLVREHGDAFAKQFFVFDDWYSNLVVHKWLGMSVPYNFHSMEEWQEIFQSHGFELAHARHTGFPQRSFHKPNVGVLLFTNTQGIEADAITMAAEAVDEFLGTGEQFAKLAQKYPYVIKIATEALDRSAAEFAYGLKILGSSPGELRKGVLELDALFAESLGLSEPDTVDALREIMQAVFDKADPKDGYFLKEEKLQELLYEHPPLQLLKDAGMSLDQVIQEYGVYEVFSVVRLTEPLEHLERLLEAYNALTPEDFEKRPLKLFAFSRDRYPAALKILDKKLTVCNDKLAGTVIAVPYSPDHDEQYAARTLRILGRTVHYLYEVMTYSDFYESLVLLDREHFGARLADAMRGYGHLYGDDLTLKSSVVPFFHPHHLQEIMCWESSVELLHVLASDIPGLDGTLAKYQNTLRALEFLSGEQEERLVSLGLLDLISIATKSYDTTYLTREMVRADIYARAVGDKGEAYLLVKHNLDKFDIADLLSPDSVRNPANPETQIFKDVLRAVKEKDYDFLRKTIPALMQMMEEALKEENENAAHDIYTHLIYSIHALERRDGRKGVERFHARAAALHIELRALAEKISASSEPVSIERIKELIIENFIGERELSYWSIAEKLGIKTFYVMEAMDALAKEGRLIKRETDEAITYIWAISGGSGQDHEQEEVKGSPPAVFGVLSDGKPRTKEEIAAALNRAVRTIEPDLYFLRDSMLLDIGKRQGKNTYAVKAGLLKEQGLITIIQEILDREFQPGSITKNLRNRDRRERIKETILDEITSFESPNVLGDLFSEDKQAVYEVFSDEKELGDIAESSSSYVSRVEEKKFFTPAPLEGLAERHIMWDFIRSPSTDLTQIIKRQDLLEALEKSSSLQLATDLKNRSYLIHKGIEGLFAPVDVSEYHREPALYAYRHGHGDTHYIRQHVMGCLDSIKEGKDALGELIETLSGIDAVIIKEVVGVLEKGLASVEYLNNDYFLDQAYDEWDAKRLSGGLNNNLMRLGAMIEFANIIVKDGYSRADFHADQAAGYKGGWNFVREKKGDKPQSLNDSPKDTLITILCGANMGGKSFHLAQNFYMQLLAQSFGYVPAKKGNFRIYDSFLYLDRASTESYYDLSAYGVDITHWVAALEKMTGRTFMLVDEGLSTTSAEDQYYMLMAIAEYLKGRGGRTLLATHNEAFINNYTQEKDAGIYHFPFTIEEKEDDGKEINYSYKLTQGPGDSRALDVAEALGLPEELIELAAQYLRDAVKEVRPLVDSEWRNPERYTEEERQALKKQGYRTIFGTEKEEEEKAFQLFSKDREFQHSFFTGTHIETGERFEDRKFGGWRYDGSMLGGSLILQLLTENKRLEPQEILERQRMFGELSENDRYEELKDIGYKLVWMLEFIPMYYMLTGNSGFLDFNRVLKPQSSELRPGNERMLSTLEYCIMFLRMNQKILGEDFSERFTELLKRLERGKELLLSYEEHVANQDILEIQALQADEYDREITDEEIIREYLELASDEPDREKWQGRLTRRRIREYMTWLKEHDRERWREIEWWHYDGNHPLRELINKVMLGYSAISVMHDRGGDFDAEQVRDEFIALADEEPLEAKERWGHRITVGRIQEYLDFLLQKHGHYTRDENTKEKINTVNDLRHNVSSTQRGLGIEDKEIRAIFDSLFGIKGDYNDRVFDDRIFRSLTDLFQAFEHINKKMPPKSIFECDLESIKEEIRFFASYYRERYKEADLAYDSRWPRPLVLSFILEMLVEEKDWIREFLGILRSYDSVHLHQMAGSLEAGFRDLLSIIKEDWWFRESKVLFGFEEETLVELIRNDIKEARRYFKRQKENIEPLCTREELEAIELELEQGSSEKLLNLIDRFNGMGPEALYEILNSVYESQMEEMLRDYAGVSRAYSRIFAEHYFLGSSESVKYIRTILKSRGTTDSRKIRDFAQNFRWLTNRDYDGRLFPYHEIEKDKSKRQKEAESFRVFYQREVIDTGLIEEIEAALGELDDAYRKVEAFVRKYNIKFKDREGRNVNKETMKRIRKNGDLYRLEEKVFGMYGNAMYSVLDSYSLRDKVKSLNGAIYETQAIALFGHMIATQGFNAVDFNSDGSVDIKGMFSMFKPGSEQELNDVHFGEDEYARLIAAPNMSGKTFYLKALVMAMLSALNTGFIPAESATMPLFDFVIYFDRVTAKLDRNLSALGNEVELWKKFFNILKSETRVFAAACVDEAFSTTSPGYQASLVYAIVMEMIRNGQYLAIATHNHDVLQVLRELEKDLLKAYTLKIRIDEESGGVDFSYELEELEEGEMTFSEAIAVARTLGMPEEILRTAEELKLNAEVQSPLYHVAPQTDL